jgi:DNA-binding PadR family transcriptional regulator
VRDGKAAVFAAYHHRLKGFIMRSSSSSSSRSSGSSGSTGFPGFSGANGFDLREAVESIRDALIPRSSNTPGEQGDIRAAILAALAVEPKNGQQVIQAISTGSGGAWMPSAGIVYPALQLLTDSGLTSTSYNGERIVYTLTAAGREAAAVMAAASSGSASMGSAPSGSGSSNSMPSNSGSSNSGSMGSGGSGSGSSSRGREGWRMPRMGEGFTMPEWGDRMSGRMNDHWNERTVAIPRAGAKLAQAAGQVTQSGTREQQERAAAILDEARKRLYAILAED